jgi:uncharacterized protein (TIGR03545 family)
VRWKGVVFLAVLFAIFIFAAWLFTDDFLENELESLGTAVNGAKVEIDDLSVSFSELYIRWKRLQVANPRQPMKNRFETAACELDFEFWPLFSDKFIVESFKVTGIMTNTDRETDGRISKEEAAAAAGYLTKTADYLEEEVSSLVTPQLNNLKKQANVDSVLKILDLRSVDKIKAATEQSRALFNDWDQKLKNLPIEKNAGQIETQIKAIDVNQLKTADQILAASQKVENIYTVIKTNANDLNQIKSQLMADLDSVRTSTAQVDNWIKDDFNRALSLARIPQINAENVGKLLFGRPVVDQVNSYLDYLALARKYSGNKAEDKPEKKSPPRLKGQDIYFYNKNARPDFWIKNMAVSGITENGINWDGSVSDIVSDQRLIGKNTVISVSGQKAGGTRLALNGLLDYLKEQPAETFDLTYSGFSLAHQKLSSSPLLPNKINAGTGSVQSGLSIRGDEIQGSLSFNGKKMKFDFSGMQNKQGKLEDVIQSILRGIDEINFKALIKGKAGHLTFSVDSNIDELFADKIGAMVNEEFDKAKKEIQRKIDAETGKYRDELNQLISGKENSLTGEVSDYENMLKQELARADSKKKEIEDIYNKEKKNLENKVKDLLKF